MDFRILGPLEVRTGTGAPRKLTRRKQRLLLAALLLNANQPVSTERLIDWLWNGRPPSSAHQNLYSYLSGLRRQLVDDDGSDRPRIQNQHRFGGCLLRVDPGELDAHGFEELVGQGRNAAMEGRHALAAEQLTRALALWRSESVLEDLDLPELLREEAIRLEQMRIDCEQALFEARLALGHRDELIADLEAATARRPLSEPLWGLRMLALYRAGRQAEALDAYHKVCDVLSAELAVKPGSELRELYQRIQDADPALAPAEPVVRPPGPAQLPRDLRTFTGRTAELERLLVPSDAGPRAVVISAIDGMAGIGKTALAVHVAHQLVPRYPDGQLFLDLHGFTAGTRPVEPAQALETLLRSLGVPDEQIPYQLDERAALWRTQAAGRRLLIVLDNAATEQQVAPLLPGGQDCFVMVTSRRRLMGLDDAAPVSLDVLSREDAITMFTATVGAERLRAETAEALADVVELCGRLPLAVRIAAARFQSRPAWTLAHLAARLRDQTPRLSELEVGRRSVAASIDLSYDQLASEPQRVFRLLGLHPGADFGVEAAAALAGVARQRSQRVLEELLDANLLQQHVVGRYRFHDLVRAHVRQLGTDQDSEADQLEALTRLLDHYVRWAAAAMGRLYLHQSGPSGRADGPAFADERAAATWLDTELPNLLATITLAGERGLPELALRLYSTVQDRLAKRARYRDSEALHGQAADLARRAGDRPREYEALAGLAHACCGQGRLEEGIDYFRRSLDVAREIGYPQGMRDALGGMANVHLAQGRFEESVACFEQALQAARRAGHDDLGILLGLGNASLARGQKESAATYFELALPKARGAGDRGGELRALIGAARSGSHSEESATALYEQALRIARELQEPPGVLTALYAFGSHYLAHHRHEPAAACFEEALALADEIGDRNFQYETLHRLGQLCLEVGDHAEALAYYDRTLELATTLGRANELVRAHHGLAVTHFSVHRIEQARRHWRTALDLLTEAGITRVRETTADEIRSHLAGLG